MVPQLFSAVLGNTTGTSAARATAAIIDMLLPAQLYALDRENDAAPGSKKGSTGNDISIQGGGGIVAYGAVSLASTDTFAGRLRHVERTREIACLAQRDPKVVESLEIARRRFQGLPKCRRSLFDPALIHQRERFLLQPLSLFTAAGDLCPYRKDQK